MEKTFEFSVTGILRYDEQGKIFGPTHAVQLARQINAEFGLSFNRIAQITFDDQRILQYKTGDELSNHPIFLFGHG